MLEGRNAVYLSGPITGQTYEEAIAWREMVAGRLMEAGFVVLSPMRRKEALARRFKDKELPPGGFRRPSLLDIALFRRDFLDVHRADIVLVNLLGAEDKSIGSVFELGWATNKGKLIVIVMDKDGNPHDHGFIKAVADVILDDLDKAVEMIIEWGS